MTVRGLRSLNRKLKALPKKVRLAQRGAMEQWANEIVALARRLVPYKDGALYASIGWTWGELPDGAIALAESRPNPDGDRILIYAGDDDAFYVRWIEFGTKAHALGKNASRQRGLRQDQGLQHPGSPAQPFFFVSYRRTRRRGRARITRATNRALKDTAK